MISIFCFKKIKCTKKTVSRGTTKTIAVFIMEQSKFRSTFRIALYYLCRGELIFSITNTIKVTSFKTLDYSGIFNSHIKNVNNYKKKKMDTDKVLNML